MKKNLSDGVKYEFKVVPYFEENSNYVESKYYGTASVCTLKAVVSVKINKSNGTFRCIKGKKYYYKIRAYKEISGTRVYGPWTISKAYTLK